MENVHIIILGSGTCVPSLERSSCAIVIQIGKENLLFDIGPGTTRRLLEAGVDVFDIGHIFLSHFHPDHSGELASFLFSYKYGNPGRSNKPLALIGGHGFLEFFQGLKQVYKHWMAFAPEQIHLFELGATGWDSMVFSQFTVETAPVDHNDESIAFKVKTPKGKTVVYSGDTDYCESLVKIAKGADLLILESSFPDEFRVQGHLTPSLAGEIARKAGVRKLVLTHFYPECNGADIPRQCRKTYKGPLILAEDLLTLSIDG
jgi:ribonuclease BN (tRNA processing enzyme)